MTMHESRLREDREIPVLNRSMDLSECADDWFYDESYECWCLEDILYTEKTTTPAFQRLSIFVPRPYLTGSGQRNPTGRSGAYTAETAPVIFENNAAGYMQMPHTWLGGPRCEAEKYLKRGMVYVTCGCRGRDSRDSNGHLCGQAPWTLIDLKTAIRFLRHNAGCLPGDWNRIISVGFSAGGAMSALLGVSGNSPLFDAYLKANGAFLDESDSVYASQIYCPVTDLEHADMAYEWQFAADHESEPGPTGPGGKMSGFQLALSEVLRERYIHYLNGLKLKDPETETMLGLNEDGEGSAYDYLVSLLEKAATKHLRKMEAGALNLPYSAEDYISGNYLRTVRELPFGKNKKEDADRHYAGSEGSLPDDGRPKDPPLSLGEMLLRPPKGTPYHGIVFPTREVPGTDKRNWLSWDGEKAHIRSLEDYTLQHRRRQKPCTAFDALDMSSAENGEFGTPVRSVSHFSTDVLEAVSSLKNRFPEEVENALAQAVSDEDLAQKLLLMNPVLLLDREDGEKARFFRIRTGASDADTSLMVSAVLALKLQKCGYTTDYALVWDQPHCEADYPGEVCDWIVEICGE